MTFLALTVIYGGDPTTRQMIVGAIIFLLTYLVPLAIMATTLHRFGRSWRAGTDTALAIVFTLLGFAVPGGVLAEGQALFFAVIAVGASIDMLHLDSPFRQIGLFTLILSAILVIATVQPAFTHALRSSYRH